MQTILRPMRGKQYAPWNMLMIGFYCVLLELCDLFTDDQWIPPHKGPVTRKMFPFDDVIMENVLLVIHFLQGCFTGHEAIVRKAW